MTDLEKIFGCSGPIAAAMNDKYRFRKSQLEMACAVERCIGRQCILLAEAGTGTGKTLAYLVPILMSGQRTIISTGTKNLQEQIFFKDIVFLEQVFGRPINAVYLKGQDNYLCKRRCREFLRSPASLMYPKAEVEYIKTWQETTSIGDRSELSNLADDDPIWKEVCSTRETRIGSKCSFYDECFVSKARKNAAAATVVIVNHHLYFADTVTRQKGGSILPRHDILVLDEAHGIEDIAVEFFSRSVSSKQIDRLVRDAMKSITVAAFDRDPSASNRERLAKNATSASADFFSKLIQQNEEGRIGFDPMNLSRQYFQDYYKLDSALDAFEQSLNSLEGQDESVDHAALCIKEIRNDLAALLTESASGYVSWMDRRSRSLVIGRSPIDVSGALREGVFFQVPSVIMTSATLSVDGDFQFLKSRVGIDFEVDEITVPSPFNYGEQACIFLPSDMVDPNDEGFTSQAADKIAELISLTCGGALVLSTSLKRMTNLYNLLVDRVPGPIMVQGMAPKRTLLTDFSKHLNSTLVATAGFWQGVDIPGDALRLVVIDKLPFASPGDPLESARITRIQENGGRPFVDYQIPAAVLLLKQGFGRLIRTEKDCGIAAILDNRLYTKGYAKKFIRSLAPCPKFQHIDNVKAWWKNKSDHNT